MGTEKLHARRQFLKLLGVEAVLIAVAGAAAIADVELNNKTSAGLGEWGKSLLARRGSTTMQKGESLIVFPGAVVTGDIRYFAPDSPISLAMSVFASQPSDLLGEPEGLPDVGSLLLVNHRLRILSPYGAHVDYMGSNISEDEILAAKFKQMSQPGNCVEGYRAVVVWRFFNREGIVKGGIPTMQAMGVYFTREQRFVPHQEQIPEQSPTIQPNLIPLKPA